MKNLLILFLSFSFSLSFGQVTSRIIEVKDGQMDKFIEMAGKKTKKYNNQEGNARFVTYEILSGPSAGNIWRLRLASAEQMDAYDLDSAESKYWQKNVVPHIKDDQVGGLFMWNYLGNYSDNVNSENQNHVMALFYNYDDSGEEDFWRFRERVAKARQSMEEKPKGSMFSLGCSSGCSGNQTVIMFEYESFAGQQAYNTEQLPKLVEKYNELFGGDAYEQDVNNMTKTLNSRRTVHMRRITEASSD